VGIGCPSPHIPEEAVTDTCSEPEEEVLS
jgi:hypothetical protein